VEIARAHQNGMDAQIRRDRVCHALEKCVRHLSAYRVVNSVPQSPQRRIPGGEPRFKERRRLGSAPSIRSRQERSKGQNPENTRETGELRWEIGWRPCRNGNLLSIANSAGLRPHSFLGINFSQTYSHLIHTRSLFVPARAVGTKSSLSSS
jgi:hypothetical protein